MEQHKNNLQWNLLKNFRGFYDQEEAMIKSIAATYVSLLAHEYLDNALLSFDLEKVLSFIQDKQLKAFLNQELQNIDQLIFNNLLNIDINLLQEFVLNIDFSNLPLYSDLRDGIPNSIIQLVNKILDIEKGNVIGDFGSGVGDYSISTVKHHFDNEYHLYDMSLKKISISKIRANVMSMKLDKKINFNINDNGILREDITEKFDKVFLHMPFNMRIDDEELLKIKKNIPVLSNLKRSTSLDWVYSVYLLSSLKDRGIGISLSAAGTSFNMSDKELRQFFVDNNYLLGVISLPNKLLSHTSIPTILYIIGKNKLGKIKMVDATNVFKEERRNNVLLDADIQKIYEAYLKETSISKDVSLKEIKENSYSLIPSRYINTIEFEDGVAFKEFVKVQRGAMFKANELDSITTQRVTNYQYLMISDVQDGLISEELKYIDNIEEKDARYIVKENNIVLSKIGVPFKSAVMDSRESKIIANGNLYIIEIDETKANPYYIQSFISSEEGQALLSSKSKGTTFASLGVNDLLETKIPLPSLEEQNRLGMEMKKTLEDLKMYTDKLEKTKVKLSKIFKMKGKQ